MLSPMPRHERPEIPEGYRQGRAMRRAILRVLLDASKPYGALRLSQHVGDVSHMAVYEHAKRMQGAGLLKQTGRGYVLTDAGREAAWLVMDCPEGLTDDD